MKFKVGDEVRIKSIQWYNENKNDKDEVVTAQGSTFYKRMVRFCGDSKVIKGVYGTFYKLEGDLFSDNWNDDMIEGGEFPKTQEEINNYLSKISIKDTNNLLSIKKHLEDNKLVLPDSIIINKSSGISSYEFIKWYKYTEYKYTEEYPKTYKECCNVLTWDGGATVIGYNAELIETIQRLMLCRNAYWKIAGEQMGLGKPWEPDWENKENTKYCITTINRQIKTITTDVFNYFLVFPTFEMRNAFFENFKDLIENCKELL